MNVLELSNTYNSISLFIKIQYYLPFIILIGLIIISISLILIVKNTNNAKKEIQKLNENLYYVFFKDK